MKRTIAILFLLISPLSLCSCDSFIKMTCDPTSAYTAGVNDAQHGRDMQQNYAIFCPVPQRAQLNSNYLRGYNYGLSFRKPYYHPHVYPRPRHPHHYHWR